METYQIIPVKTGAFTNLERSAFLYLIDAGVKIEEPILMFVIKGRDKLILVDTGVSDEDWARKYHHPIRQKEEEKPLNALRRLGISPADVEIIINSHLHWDHCFNNQCFPNAKIYIQRREMQYAISPLPVHYLFYESYQIGMHPQWLNALTKIEALDGEYKLCDGITLIPLPGHTPGLQGVLVNTEDGPYLLPSDTTPLLENWEGNAMHRHIPAGIHYSLPEYYDTFRKMDALGAKIIASHDEKVVAKKVYP